MQPLPRPLASIVSRAALAVCCTLSAFASGAGAQAGTGLVRHHTYRPTCGTFLCLVFEDGRIERPGEFGGYLRVASARPTAAFAALGADAWFADVFLLIGEHVACPSGPIGVGCSAYWETGGDFLSVSSFSLPGGTGRGDGLYEFAVSDAFGCPNFDTTCIDRVGIEVSGPAIFSALDAQGREIAREDFRLTLIAAPEPATLALTAGGLLALAGVAARRGRG